MSRLEQLIEQTAFLLDMQSKAKDESTQTFTGLLNFLDQKIKSDHADKELLESIHDMLSGHAQQFTDQVQEDIEFLESNIEALNEIKNIEDPEKSKEVLKSVIEDDEQLPETAEFKKSVTAEYAESKKGLSEMVQEIQEMIEGGKVKEVKLLIEAFVQEYEEDVEEDGDHECDQNCDGCPSSCGQDIFEILKEEDKKE